MTDTPAASAAVVATTRVSDPCSVAERLLAAAYSDCHEHFRGARVPERNLNFCCPVTISLEEA